ncbi:glycosyltransferase [bacterium 1XD42-94]|jgi:GT2 family glycosyltransferase/glycosyltransferase involved in cell wall biosynthesis|nr:glycosyltransferase [bacterium 1XD42-76]NBK05518.1 glycosyltransferase [bacterium 1XD42-94]
MGNMEGIDIIIPVYNAYEDLRRCVESVLRNTDLEKNRLILVDDASPDPRIRPYMKELESEHVLVVANDTNMGFSGSINRGIDASGDRDVIFLNSDVIVTAQWVEKLSACAYHDGWTATVTPLSNNATLCSVPEFLQENSVPDNFTIDEYAALIANRSLKKYFSIPVANGFCMYVKREIIDLIGNLDADTFGRGYGEENDFCHRAEQFGYHHLMCDDTFIYHAGTGSFVSAEKKKYIDQHARILQERYPGQVQRLQEFLNSNPNRIINENIKLHLRIKSEKKNLLFLLQSDFRDDADDAVGGVQLHVKDLTMGLKADFNIYVAARNFNYLNVTRYSGDSEPVFFQFFIDYVPEFPQFMNSDIGNVLGNILDAFEIHLVHVHHIKDLSLEIYDQAQIRNIPITATLHDYYYICPMIKLLDHAGNVCTGSARDGCGQCLKAGLHMANGDSYIHYWRKRNQTALQWADSLFVPSGAAAGIYMEYFPELAPKLKVIEHGIPDSFTKVSVEEHSKSREFRVAFIGGLSPEKGGDVACELVQTSPDDIKWYAFGMMGYTNLKILERKNLVKTGEYRREELPQLLKQYQIDLVCILSLWPETYCYTLSEALQCGVPVIVTGIGALPERVKRSGCGWVVTPERAVEETQEILARIKSRPAEFEECRKWAQQTELPSIEEMAQGYCQEYLRIFHKSVPPTWKTADYEAILNAYFHANGMESLIDQNDGVYRRLLAAETELAHIHKSLAYKLGLALCQIKVPLKPQLKKLAYRIYKRM